MAVRYTFRLYRCPLSVSIFRSFHSGQEVPQDAIVGGRDLDGSDLYVARVHVDTDNDGAQCPPSVQPGKFGQGTGRGALVAFAGKGM